jgi:hypothetical protein
VAGGEREKLPRDYLRNRDRNQPDSSGVIDIHQHVVSAFLAERD